MLKTEEFDKAPTKPLSMICYRNSETKFPYPLVNSNTVISGGIPTLPG